MYTELVNLLKAARHDWLNHLQLIKGHLSLQKVDRAQNVIEEIISKTRNEAKLTNLNVPVLASKLLTFNWYAHPYQMELEVVGGGMSLSEWDNDMAEALGKILALFDDYASAKAQNYMTLSIHIYEQSSVLSVDFVGRLNNPDQVNHLLDRIDMHPSMSLVENYLNETEAVISLEISEA